MPSRGFGIGGGDRARPARRRASIVPAVDAAGEQDHVGAQVADALDLLVGQAAVVGGDDVHDDRAGAERGALGALGGHRLDHAGDHHLQAAAGARGRDVDVDAPVSVVRVDDRLPVEDLAAGELLDLPDRVEHAARDILERRLDRGRGLAADDQPILVVDELDEDRLGGGEPQSVASDRS